MTRFGLGARPGEIERVAADPPGWLAARVTPGGRARGRGAEAGAA
ncbi:hypothetical protein [Brevundimonas sp.]|nr:hypothetical protein [Brevundimonas sp.]HWQ88248.1 hypothetical protein [Brevundimonas sp.]